MTSNQELITIFEQMSAVLELTGANPFRVNAHANVARAIKNLTRDVAELADDPKKLTAIDGIGVGSAKKIIEYIETGEVAEHLQLLEEIPVGLLEVLRIPGLGPKTVKAMWETADVTDLASLKQAIETGELEQVPRMGAKTIENLRESLAFAEQSSQRIRLGVALPMAEAFIEQLESIKGVQRIAYAGSLRRGCETIGDIDLLAATSQPKVLAEAFQSLPGVTKVLAGGETKNSIRLDAGIQVDLRMIDKASFGAALLYFTGSKDHNVVLRERAIRKGLRLNEYGLFPVDDEKKDPPQKRGARPVAAKSEEAIYKKLDLPYIAPQLREDRGEFDTTLPKLIEFADIKSELHAHTTASDGRWSIEQLAAEAKRRGFHTVAVTDHSKSSAQANGLSPDRLREHIEAIHNANEQTNGIEILAGSEVDILAHGQLDYDDDLLAELDIVVASPHSSLRQDPAKATARLLAAIEHPLVHILGHPTGRYINKREGLHPDINTLVEAAAEHDTALEINANFVRLDLRDTHVRAAGEGGALLTINCDSHSAADMDHLRYGILTGQRGRLTAKQCINTWTKKKLHEWLRAKR